MNEIKKILLVTVGGSHQPIVTSINSLKPDRVVFFCSDGPKGSKSQAVGEGKPCEDRRKGERLPNIPTQTDLGERFQKDRDVELLQNPDDLSECYMCAGKCIQNLKQEFPQAQIQADYTGGTKSMSIALAMAALDHEVTLYLTSGKRTNIIRVERGERVRLASIASVKVEREITQFLPTFLKNYNYPAAIDRLKRLELEIEISTRERQRLDILLDCCMGFDAWDRFEHLEAWEILRDHQSNDKVRSICEFLRKVMISRERFAEATDDGFRSSVKGKAHGYEIIEDIVLNAERRAKLERYDDAVARLYRALEMLVQIRFWYAYGIKTGDVDVAKLPETLRLGYEKLQKNENSKIQLGLAEAYSLLCKMPDEPIAAICRNSFDSVMNSLKFRNYSILAHGLRPVTKQNYQTFSQITTSFIRESIKSCCKGALVYGSQQFPTDFFDIQ